MPMFYGVLAASRAAGRRPGTTPPPRTDEHSRED